MVALRPLSQYFQDFFLTKNTWQDIANLKSKLYFLENHLLTV